MPNTLTQIESKRNSRTSNHRPDRRAYARLDMDLLRRLDWRFMLPDLSLEHVVYFGDINTPLYQALHKVSKTMIINPTYYQEYEIPVKEPYIVVLTEDKKLTVRKALSWVSGVNTLYWESDPKVAAITLLKNFLRIYPGHYKDRVKMLKTRHLQSADATLHWPSIKKCREFIPLDTPLVRNRFIKYSKGKKNKLLGWLITLCFKTKLYQYCLLSYSIIGRHYPNDRER
ncbi:hypothetical protein GF406_14225 [candidate division KSB1 bacterium]|nr:hypothetical protein [candidate division KSB1 bacterium]